MKKYEKYLNEGKFGVGSEKYKTLKIDPLAVGGSLDYLYSELELIEKWIRAGDHNKALRELSVMVKRLRPYIK